MADHVQTIRDIYAAFQRGDIPAVLSRVAEDVQWEQWPDHHGQKAGVPWLKARRGRQDVVGFFQLLGTYKFLDFTVTNVMSGGNQVAGCVNVEIELPNGRRIRDEEIHLFTFNARGEVSAFRHYQDTAKAIAASEGLR